MGPAIFGYARFGSIVFGSYGISVIISPGLVTSDLIVLARAEIRRVVTARAIIHSSVDLVSQIRTKVNTTIER